MMKNISMIYLLFIVHSIYFKKEVCTYYKSKYDMLINYQLITYQQI